MFKYFVRVKSVFREIIFTSISLFNDILSILRYNNKKIKKYRGNNQTLVFVADRTMPRIPKIGLELIKKGYYIILLTKQATSFDREVFSEVIIYHSFLGLNFYTKKIKSNIIHVFSLWNFNTAYYLIKNKPGKIVFDDYDVLAGMVNEKYASINLPNQYKKEKYCLENADAICCRSIETQYAKRYMGYQIKGKRIFFPEYLWKESLAIDNIDKKEKVLVYAGNCNRFAIKIAEELQKIDWQFDVYPAITKNIFKNIPHNLKLYKTVLPNKLIETLSNYQYALLMPPELAELEGVYTLNKRKYAMSGKIFDYLEANLKIVISEYDFLIFLVKRYSSCIVLEKGKAIESLADKLASFQDENLLIKYDVNNIILENNINRLIKFYHSI